MHVNNTQFVADLHNLLLMYHIFLSRISEAYLMSTLMRGWDRFSTKSCGLISKIIMIIECRCEWDVHQVDQDFYSSSYLGFVKVKFWIYSVHFFWYDNEESLAAQIHFFHLEWWSGFDFFFPCKSFFFQRLDEVFIKLLLFSSFAVLEELFNCIVTSSTFLPFWKTSTSPNIILHLFFLSLKSF
jgi:hypothetical protein